LNTQLLCDLSLITNLYWDWP